jgi:hypothetical protein
MRRRQLLALALVLCLVPACRFWRGRDGGAPSAEVVDLNSAPQWRVEQLPGVTPSMAKRIVQGRPYGEAEDLVERGVLTRREFERIEELVVVSQPTH